MNSSLKESILSLKPSCIYGLGVTGLSVINFICRRTNFQPYVWDDDLNARYTNRSKFMYKNYLKTKIGKKIFVYVKLIFSFSISMIEERPIIINVIDSVSA